MRRQVVRSVAWLLLIAMVVIGVVALGRWSLQRLKSDDRFRTTFRDIECDAPPGMTKSAFLDEVEYVAGSLPKRLEKRFPIADGETLDVVREAFKKHPWVLSVEEMEPKPPARLRVNLVFRRPALAVPWKGDVRVVDDRGVLLPKTANPNGLPIFSGTPTPPGDAGEPWPDADVIRQALQR